MKYLFFLLLIPNLIFSQGSGNTLRFNGVDEAIDLGNTVANNCRTIEMWFKPTTTITSSDDEPSSLIVRDFNSGDGASTNEFGLGFVPFSWGEGGKLFFFRRIGSIQHIIHSDADLWVEEHWYHVAVTIDPVNGMSMYINGVKQESSDSSTESIGTQIGGQTDHVSLAKWGNIDIRYFDGEIDEVRFWENSKTQIEIQQHMCSKLNGNESGLRAYYNFDSQNPSSLFDVSTNSNTGSLLGMNDSNRLFSGAPIGDTSIYLYDDLELLGQSLSLAESTNNYLTVDSINSTSKGIHIYKVNSFPNSFSNLSNPTSSYYGVFLTNISGTFNLNYNFSNISCQCPDIFSRNDNSILPWTILNGANINCNIQLNNQSTIGYDYRAEFIINNNSIFLDIGNDTTICLGDTLILDAGNSNATYLWQDNSNNQILTVNQEGTYWVIANNNGCSAIDSIFIMVNIPPTLEIGNDTTICQGESLILDAGNSNATYLWQNDSNSQFLIVNQEGIYWVIANNNGCTVIDSINVGVNIPPSVEIGNDTIICQGETLILDAGNSDVKYLWQDSSEDQSFVGNEEGMYSVTVTNECGVDSSNLSLQIDDCLCSIYFPNVFSPNLDGINDVFLAQHTCDFEYYMLFIYNRWGELIFKSNDPSEAWNGTYKGIESAIDVYAYLLQYSQHGKVQEQLYGNVTLIR